MGTFYSEVIARDSRFDSLARVSDSSLLEPMTRRLVERLVDSANRMGIEVMIYETYRSPDRQLALFNGGATKLRTVGVHHYGLACDVVRVISGEPSWKGDFTFLGQLARSYGLIWGGDWGDPDIRHGFVDSVHLQRCTVTRQGDLFAGTWYPGDTYNPYDDVQHFSAATADLAVNKPPAKIIARPQSRRSRNKRA